jgi:hypothetical protein
MAARRSTLEQVMAFRQCELCGLDLATGEGDRGCHYYECPYLPEALDVRCPTCLYNFYTADGNPECSDPPACEFARVIAPQRVETLRAWLDAQGREPAAR